MVSAIQRSTLTLLVAVVLPAGLAAQETVPCFDPSPTATRQAVYYTGPDNDISCVLDWTTGTSRQVVSTNGALFKGLVVRYEGESGGLSIVAASTTQGGDIQVFDCNVDGESCQFVGRAADFNKVGGVALDTFGNLAAVNGSQLLYISRCTSGQVGCPASGYDESEARRLTPDGLSGLASVKFVSEAIARDDSPEAYQPGDVLILAAEGIVRFAAADLANPEIDPVWAEVAADFDGTQPTGIALFPTSGEILVATNEGRLLVFDREGNRQAQDFAEISGQGVRVAIGNPGGQSTDGDPANGSEVFLTANSSGRVFRFVTERRKGKGSLVAADPYPTDFLTTGNPPNGVGNATLTDAAWTPTGNDVTVLPVLGDTMVIQQVRSQGFTTGRVYLIRESSVRAANNQITGEMIGLPSGFARTMPTYFRGVAQGEGALTRCLEDGEAILDPSDYADCYFLVHVIESGADIIGGTVEHDLDEGAFGLVHNEHPEPDHDPATPAVYPNACHVETGYPAPRQPRGFYATDHDDPAIIEGALFIDATTACGTHRRRGGYSEGYSVLVSGWDTRVPNNGTPADISWGKLTNLGAVLAEKDPSVGGLAGYVPKKILNRLKRNQKKAWGSYTRGDTAAAVAQLESLIATVEANTGAFKDTYKDVTRNAAGELVARAETAIYTLWGARDCCQRLLENGVCACE